MKFYLLVNLSQAKSKFSILHLHPGTGDTALASHSTAAQPPTAAISLQRYFYYLSFSITFPQRRTSARLAISSTGAGPNIACSAKDIQVFQLNSKFSSFFVHFIQRPSTAQSRSLSPLSWLFCYCQQSYLLSEANLRTFKSFGL